MSSTSVDAGGTGVLPLGTLIAERYGLGPLLGRGGMADVHAGVDQRLQRPVAIKLLRPEMSARADIRARFEAEARAAAGLNHPNIVAVFDTGEHEGVPYIVMEKLPGETLGDRIGAGPADPEWTRQVAADVLAALGAAHASGVVHRDVKPGNILIAADGRAKVSDFGIAKSVQETDASVDLTATGQLLGTPAYLAPERLQGAPASPQSDLYSLGVVLYEALAGTKPFPGATPLAVANAILNGDHEPLTKVRPDLHAGLAAAVEQAMDADPARRFRSADAMATALGVSAGVPLPPPQDATVRADVDRTVTAGPAPTSQLGVTRRWPTLGARRLPLVPLLVATLALMAVLVALVVARGGNGAPQRPASSPLPAPTTVPAAQLGPPPGDLPAQEVPDPDAVPPALSPEPPAPPIAREPAERSERRERDEERKPDKKRGRGGDD